MSHQGFYELLNTYKKEEMNLFGSTHDRRETDPKLESLVKDVEYCKIAKDNLLIKVERLENNNNNITNLITKHDTQIDDLEDYKQDAVNSRDEDRKLYSDAVSALKQQMVDLESSVTDKIVSQDKHLSEQTSKMIESHDEKTLKLFEKIEQKIEKNDAKTFHEFNKLHEKSDKEFSNFHHKIDEITANQSKFMGGVAVIVFIVSLYSAYVSSSKEETKVDTRTQQLSEVITLLKSKN